MSSAWCCPTAARTRPATSSIASEPRRRWSRSRPASPPGTAASTPVRCWSGPTSPCTGPRAGAEARPSSPARPRHSHRVPSGPGEEFFRRHTTELTLADGTPVLLRPILPEDKGVLAAGFAELSPESRHTRFFVAPASLSTEMLAHLTEIDYVDHFAWLAFVGDTEPRRGAGVARYIRVRRDPQSAEA